MPISWRTRTASWWARTNTRTLCGRPHPRTVARSRLPGVPLSLRNPRIGKYQASPVAGPPAETLVSTTTRSIPTNRLGVHA